VQLNNADQIPAISHRAGFAIFELPDADFSAILTNSLHIKPNEKNIINIEQIREIMPLVQGRQSTDFTIVIEHAELMNEAAANAFLKALEEPNDFVHFVFLTRSSSSILPTIKSRAHNYYVASSVKLADPLQGDAKIIDLAKRYIACTPAGLPKLAAEIAKDKNDARGKAIKVVDASIQLLYKSYFLTGNNAFIVKLDKLLGVYEALQANGHIKLQLVAGML
jgi:hypothetical protein